MAAEPTVELSVDGKILRSLKQETAKLVVVGHFKGGLSSTKTRIEANKAACGNYFIEKIPLETPIDCVVERIRKAQKQAKYLVFLHDYWEALAKTNDMPN
jgi:hypothetical protein